MNTCAKLGLGTVQWGMTYGIANSVGQPSDVEIGNLLRIARQHAITLLDTASTYGEAESNIGNQNAASQGFQVVTKTPPIKSEKIRAQDIAAVSAAFLESLRRLRCEKVYGLLVHHADNLLLPEVKSLWAALQDLKAKGSVEKIGVSVYHPAQLEKILERHDIDLVQLPYNLYDQRFAQTGMLKRLKKNGVEIHARSVFLQGLLLLSPDKLPEHFHSIRDHHANLYREIKDAGLLPREACLRFCLDNSDIDRVIVGCETAQQLSEIIDAAEKRSGYLAWAEFSAVNNESIINPSAWPQ